MNHVIYGVVSVENPNYLEATFTNKSDALDFANVRYYYTGHPHKVINIE